MEIQHFDDLLAAARAQAQPQRLLMVFVATELPEDASAEQRARFAEGEGGALVPLMCVDKTPEELDSFATLLAEPVPSTPAQFERFMQQERSKYQALVKRSGAQVD